MNAEYKFYLRIGSTSAAMNEVRPVWKDDLALEYALENGQWFYRRQLTGNLVFLKADYQLIMQQTFGTKFYVEIQKSDDGGVTWATYWTGKFTKTDCTINVDDTKITVKPTVVDQYTDILEGWEKEYDLIKLTPAMQKILVRKRPCIQIYSDGDKIVSCFMGAVHWEQDADMPSDVDNTEDYLRRSCHFAAISSYMELNFYDVPSSQQSYFQQPFTSAAKLVDGTILRNTTNYYEIEYYQYSEPVQGYNNVVLLTIGLNIYKVGDTHDAAHLKWNFNYQVASSYYQEYPALPEEIKFTAKQSGLTNIKAAKATQNVWGRILCNVENLGGTPTYPLYNNDLVGDNRNYRRAVGYGGSNELVQSSDYSVQPTEWGQRDDGTYFVQPDNDSRYVPIGRSKWVNTSLWFFPSSYTQNAERMGRYAYTLNDAYPLWSCISVLLAEVAPGVTFAGNVNYSAFLYGGSDALALRDNALYLTPKSNIVAGEYQTPAQTAPVTLKTLLDMLKNTYKCQWFIDSQNRLRIEHVEWFRRGGSYDGAMSVGLDLTAMKNIRTGLAWSYGTNEYTFDKQDMPQRYEFEWMDEVTALFKGNPIEVVSPYVQQDKKEEVTVSQVTTDVDFILLNPNAISKEGFVLMTAETANAVTGTTMAANDSETEIVPVAQYAVNRQNDINIGIGGSGTVTVVWYKGDEREVSQIVFSLPYNTATRTITVPDGVTGMSFLASADAYIMLFWMHPTQNNILQLPMVEQMYGGMNYILQNGYLSFFMLQEPYWRYDMPASVLNINGTQMAAYSVQKNRKQTVNIPVGNDDPDVQRLIRTGIGNGQVQQMSIRLTSRMAKTQLRYDTE